MPPTNATTFHKCYQYFCLIQLAPLYVYENPLDAHLGTSFELQLALPS
jgi:hypothetical protein